MKEKIAILSVFANALLAAGKIAVGVISNSSAIIAAGVDSLVDIFSSAVSYVGIRVSKKPADKEHPYGYHKVEVLGGVIITAIIAATGIGIVYDAFMNLFDPQEIGLGYLAFGIMIFAGIVNEIMARLKIYYGKRENSISLLSDGVHSRIDVYASLAILVGLCLAKYWVYADSVLAMLMGIYVVKEGLSTGREAVDSLLDVSAGDEIENKIKSILIKSNIKLVALKTQKKGSAITATLEVELPSDLKVDEAASISKELREKLMYEVDGLQYVVIQISSHEIESNFYKPSFSRGFGWQRKGRFQEQFEKATGKGPDGACVCPKCGFTVSHRRGMPCSTLKCPKCDINLERK